MKKFGVCLTDWHLSVNVGRYGLTMGPLFLSLDKDNDIACQVISPPEWVKSRFKISDVHFHFEI